MVAYRISAYAATLIVKPNVFANNRISMQLVSTNPVSGLIGNMSVLFHNTGCLVTNDTI